MKLQIFYGEKPKRNTTEVFNSINQKSIGVVPIEHNIEGLVHELSIIYLKMKIFM